MAMYKCPKASKKREKCTLTVSLTLKYGLGYAYAGSSYGNNQNSSQKDYTEVFSWYVDDPNNTIQIDSKEPNASVRLCSVSTGNGVASVALSAPTFTSSTKKFKIKFHASSYDGRSSEDVDAFFEFAINISQDGKYSSITRTEFNETTCGSTTAYAKVRASSSYILTSATAEYTKE